MNFVPTERMHNPMLSARTFLRFETRPVTLGAIVEATDYAPLSDTIRLLERWRGAGLIQQVKKPERYIMENKARDLRDPPVVGERLRGVKARSARQRLWSAIRVMKSFDLIEICFAASVQKPIGRDLLNQLTRAGYLTRTDKEGDDQPSWRLVRPSGPHHPIAEYQGRKIVALIDGLTHERFPLPQRQKNLAAEINHVS